MRRFLRYMRASGRLGAGSRHMRRAEYADARAKFIDGLRLLGTEEPKGANAGVWFSTRLGILQGLAQCAAKLDEIALARSSIEEAMTLWKSADIGPVSKYRGLSEWMSWANAYLAWSSKGDVN